MGNVTVSGSYRKFPDVVGADLEAFAQFGWSVLSPRSASILASVDGFVSLKKDAVERIDRVAESSLPSAFQLIENGHLNAIKSSDALWLVMPSGYLGVSASLEMGWALAHNVPIYCQLQDWLETKEPMVRAYVEPVQDIAHLIANFNPNPKASPAVGRGLVEGAARVLYGDASNANVAVAPLLIDWSRKQPGNPDVPLVETYKWRGLSIPGERLRRGEGFKRGLERIMREQLDVTGEVGEVVYASEEIPNGGYWQPNTSRKFVDFAVTTDLSRITLDDRASRVVVMPLDEVLRLPPDQIEPNARAAYEALQRRVA